MVWRIHPFSPPSAIGPFSVFHLAFQFVFAFGHLAAAAPSQSSIVFWKCMFSDWHPLKFHLIPISSPFVIEFYLACSWLPQSRVLSQSISLHRMVTHFRFTALSWETISSKKVISKVVSFTASDLFKCKAVSMFHSWVSFTANLVSLPWFAFGIRASEFDLCLNLSHLLFGCVSAVAGSIETLWGSWW